MSRLPRIFGTQRTNWEGTGSETFTDPPRIVASDLRSMPDVSSITGRTDVLAPVAATADPCKCDPVGIVEIAERLDVQRATVDKWRTRGLLPEPWLVISGTPIWEWNEIGAWAQVTGRL